MRSAPMRCLPIGENRSYRHCPFDAPVLNQQQHVAWTLQWFVLVVFRVGNEVCQEAVLSEWCDAMASPSIVQLGNPFELMYNTKLDALSTQSLMVHQTLPGSPLSLLNGAVTVHCRAEIFS
jgi:hypothetical protein